MKIWVDGAKGPKDGHGYHDWVNTMRLAIDELLTGKVSFLSVGWDFKDGRNGLDLLRWISRNPECWPPHGVAVHFAPKEFKPEMQNIIESRYRRQFQSFPR